MRQIISTTNEWIYLIDEMDCGCLEKLFNLVDSGKADDDDLVELYAYDNIFHIMQIYADKHIGRAGHEILVYDAVGYGWIDNRLMDPDDKIWTTKMRLTPKIRKKAIFFR